MKPKLALKALEGTNKLDEITIEPGQHVTLVLDAEDVEKLAWWGIDLDIKKPECEFVAVKDGLPEWALAMFRQFEDKVRVNSYSHSIETDFTGNGACGYMEIAPKKSIIVNLASIELVDGGVNGEMPKEIECDLINGSVKINVELKGDVNKDGVVNVSDLVQVRMALGTDDKNADINKDGVVNVSDLVLIRGLLNDARSKTIKRG